MELQSFWWYTNTVMWLSFGLVCQSRCQSPLLVFSYKLTLASIKVRKWQKTEMKAGIFKEKRGIGSCIAIPCGSVYFLVSVTPFPVTSA